jgi:cysteinyl-tRNA synthetase
MNVSIFNTMSRTVEPFEPISQESVRMYCCGPTVYAYAHIGNLRTYVFEDLLRRTLEYAGYRVRHVMNITDVGHLTGDSDDGEDKMLKSSKESGRDVYEIARFYTDAFFKDTEELNIQRPDVSCRATDHIGDMIALIRRLEAGGHTYVAGGNVYFSIDTFPRYGEMARLNLEELRSGARIDVDPNKRNPKDFVLWFTNSKFENQAMLWDSPWGRGYPGWHIECSAMSMKYLGESFDIHCGGIDHVSVHHTNEIAQSEAATGKRWVKYWVHGEFLINDSGKMSKSKGEFLTLQLLKERSFEPMDYRYFCLGAHYRSQLQFSWEALTSARNARKNLYDRIAALRHSTAGKPESDLGEGALSYLKRFAEHMGNDLNAPRALAELWSMLKDQDIPDAHKLACALHMDRILGFNLASIPAARDEEPVPADIMALVEERAAAKRAKNYARADELRGIVEQAGYRLKDTPGKTIVVRSCNQDQG